MTASAGPVLQQLHDRFGDRVAFVTLYVREAHPGERHPQAETFEQKLRFAREYRERDRIPWPVAVDSVTGDLHRALDGKPNAAYLMDTEGRVAFRSLWSNTRAPLERTLETVVSGRPLERREDESKVVPMVRGMGKMRDVLLEGGRVAERDVLRAMPPLYAMATVASFFRPLSPLGRGIAAIAVTLVAVAVTAATVRGVVGASRAD
jgi:hypothetical protein